MGKFLIGLFIGAWLGMLYMAMFTIAKEADEGSERYAESISDSAEESTTGRCE